MASHAFSDGVIRLAQAPEAQRGRTLLKAATELFVAGQEHDRTEIAVFEELALQLLRITPLADRIAIARLLAPHPDAPASVIGMLARDDIEVAEAVIRSAPNLSALDMLGLVQRAGLPHLERLAARPSLPADVVEALALRLPPASLAVLVDNPTIRLPRNAEARLAEAARGLPALARALSRRHQDVEDTSLTDFFLDLDEKGRRRVIQSLEILALRDFAARRPLPPSPRPDPEVIAELARAALARDYDIVARHLAGLLSIELRLARRLVADRGGEPLAIALKAAGIDAPTATRIILFSGGEDVRDYFQVKRLVELHEQVTNRSATLLVARWRGESEPLPERAAARYMPQTEAGTPVRARPAQEAPARVRPAAASAALPPRRDRA